MSPRTDSQEGRDMPSLSTPKSMSEPMRSGSIGPELWRQKYMDVPSWKSFGRSCACGGDKWGQWWGGDEWGQKWRHRWANE